MAAHPSTGKVHPSPSDDESATRLSLFERLRLPEKRESAWTEFKTRYGPMITGCALRFGAKSQDVEDILQDVIAGFLSASNAFVYDRAKWNGMGKGAFRSYLKKAVLTATIRWLDKTRKNNGVSLNGINDLEQEVESVWNETWEYELTVQALNCLREGVASKQQFRAFEQHVILDHPACRVAAELNMSVNSVHQAKSRMIRQLRKIVAELRDAWE